MKTKNAHSLGLYLLRGGERKKKKKKKNACDGLYHGPDPDGLSGLCGLCPCVYLFRLCGLCRWTSEKKKQKQKQKKKKKKKKRCVPHYHQRVW
jgi:hypothetical protein